MRRILQLFAMAALLVTSARAATPASSILDDQTRADLVKFVSELCDWAVEIDVGSGALDSRETSTSVFINSNLSRMLLAGYELTGRENYRAEAIDWFDHLVTLQVPVTTNAGTPGGFWGDLAPNRNIYFGDAGTAAAGLAGAVRFTDGERRQKYLDALQRYADFVRYGTPEDPQGKGRPAPLKGWIISSGPDAGALGCGYLSDELSTSPYTVSTSTTGASFYSGFALLSGNDDYAEIARNAARYVISLREPDGEIPYILHGERHENWPLDTLTYAAEGIVAVALRQPAVADEFASGTLPSVKWALGRQNADGTWGELRSEDQKRSQGIVNLLVWHYERSGDPAVREAILKNIRYVLDPANAARFGMKELPRNTGFTGLAMAEVLEPGITYRVE